MKSQKLEAIRACIAAGGDALDCCVRHGVPRGTYYRWAAKEAQGGLAALTDGKGTGRPASLELNEEEARGLRGLCLLLKGAEAGLTRWLEESALPVGKRKWPEFPPALPATLTELQGRLARSRAEGKRPSWPITVRRAMQTTVNERGRLRGGHEELHAKPSARRAMVWVDEQDQVHAILAGHIYSSDDMSLNEPFRYWDPALGRETVGRQALLTSDLYSHGILGQTLIGRRKDAYRVEDIADHVSDIVAQAGLPLIWRFEKGVWDNNFIYGLKPPPSWMLPAGTLFGALDGVLFRAAQKHTPRGKGEIENAFKNYQRHAYMRSTSVGTVRGEFKTTSRFYRQAIEGNANALQNFWAMHECREGSAAALVHYHAAPQTRRAFGNVPHTPAELWGEPARREVPASEAWRLLPVKAWGSVRQGVYECKVEHWPVSFRFLVSGSPGCPTLDNGHRVFAAFHPAKPGLGCHLFNGETKEGRSHEHGRRVNRDGFRLLEPLGVATWWPDVAQENYGSAAGKYTAQQQAASALRSEFQAAFPKGTSLGRKSRATDNYGRIVAAGNAVSREEVAATASAEAAQSGGLEAPATAPRPRRASLAGGGDDLVNLYRQALPAREAELQTAGE